MYCSQELSALGAFRMIHRPSGEELRTARDVLDVTRPSHLPPARPIAPVSSSIGADPVPSFTPSVVCPRFSFNTNEGSVRVTYDTAATPPPQRHPIPTTIEELPAESPIVSQHPSSFVPSASLPRQSAPPGVTLSPPASSTERHDPRLQKPLPDFAPTPLTIRPPRRRSPRTGR